MYWRTTDDDAAGSQSLSCFIDYCVSTSEKSAIVWGDTTSVCAKISSLSYDNASITAELKRPNSLLPGPTASGDVAIEINRDCNPGLTLFRRPGTWPGIVIRRFLARKAHYLQPTQTAQR